MSPSIKSRHRIKSLNDNELSIQHKWTLNSPALRNQVSTEMSLNLKIPTISKINCKKVHLRPLNTLEGFDNSFFRTALSPQPRLNTRNENVSSPQNPKEFGYLRMTTSMSKRIMSQQRGRSTLALNFSTILPFIFLELKSRELKLIDSSETSTPDKLSKLSRVLN